MTLQHRCDDAGRVTRDRDEAGRARLGVVLIVAGAVATVLGVVALVAFEPWRLFTSSEVHEELPTSEGDAAGSGAGGGAGDGATEATDEEVARGAFETAEHETSGEAAIWELADGRRFVRLEDLATSDGPDLHVILSDAPSGGEWGSYDDGAWTDLGELTATHGDQNYEIPADADLTGVQSIVVWCDRFDVAFGSAPVDVAG